MSETCGHGGCYFDRPKYCEVSAADPNGSAGVVTEMLEALIYECGQVTSDEFVLSSERDGQTFTRSFSHLQGDPHSWVWPLTETKLEIRHVQDKRLGAERYEVMLGWRALQLGATEEYFVTRYGVDVYRQGDVQAYIEEPDIISDTRITRRMTEYDYGKLFDGLGVFYDLQAAERNDNARVV